MAPYLDIAYQQTNGKQTNIGYYKERVTSLEIFSICCVFTCALILKGTTTALVYHSEIEKRTLFL